MDKAKTEALFIGQKHNEFTNDENEVISYYEAQFVISEDGEPKTLTLRQQDPMIKGQPSFKKIWEDGMVKGILQYKWDRNDYNDTYKPKFENFKPIN